MAVKKQGKAKNVKKDLSADGIKFKSELELNAYKYLKEQGLNPLYEPTTYVVSSGFKPSVLYYIGNKREVKKNMRQLAPIKYTPDFEFDYNEYHIIVEMKGWENDAFPLRFKLFRKFIESTKQHYIIAKIFTIGQLKTFIELLKNEF